MKKKTLTRVFFLCGLLALILCFNNVALAADNPDPRQIGLTKWSRVNNTLTASIAAKPAGAGALPKTAYSHIVSFGQPSMTLGRVANLINIKGLESWDGNPGAPIMPFKPVKLLIPYGQSLSSIKVYLGKEISLPGTYKIEQAQKSYPLSRPDLAKFTAPDSVIYNSDEAYPSFPCGDAFIQKKHGFTFLILNLFPVKYIPKSGKLSYYNQMSVELETIPAAQLKTTDIKPNPSGMNEIQKNVDNPVLISSYETAVKQAAPLTEDFQYVIITTNALKNGTGQPFSFDNLIASKQSKGLTAKIVTVENDIYPFYPGIDNQTKIRNFIIYYYQNHNTRFVLLGGDKTNIPPRMFFVNAYDGTYMPADMYYGCLDGTFDFDSDGIYGEPTDGIDGGEVDIYGEVGIGRICASTPAEVSNFVKKTLAYEFSDDPYRANVYMVGEHLGFSGISEYATECMEQIRLGSSADGYTTVGFEDSADADRYDTQSLYDAPGYSWDPKTDLVPLINNGVHILNHLGHSNYTTNMKLSVTVGDLALLNNNKYFFAYSQGCMPGGFDTNECFAEVITTMEKGAFAVVMNARYGFGRWCSTDGFSQRYNREFWDALFNDGITNLGGMNQKSKEDNAYRINEDGLIMRWCCYELNLFGDPELSITPTIYTITATAGTGGTIAPSGAVKVPINSDKIFTITPNSGSAILDVLVDGASVGAVSSYEFTDVNSNHSIAVTFTQNHYNLTVNSGAGSGNYLHGTLVNITANPPPSNQRFNRWTGDTQNIADIHDPTTTIKMLAPASITAEYIPGTYAVNTYSQHGTVTKNPDKPAGYAYGDAVILTALPETFYHLTNWSGDVPAGHELDNPLSIIVDDDKDITASFALNTYIIAATIGSAGGNISPKGNVSVQACSNATFTITANTGYHISDVLVDGSSLGAISSYTFSNVTTNHTIEARFAVNTYQLTVNSGSGSGTYVHGTVVNIKANDPAAGYHFVHWVGDTANIDNPASPVAAITILSDSVVTATYTINLYTLTLDAENGSITADPPGLSYAHGTDVVLTARPLPGWHFDGWSADLTGTMNPVTIHMDSNKSVTADFIPPEPPPLPYIDSTSPASSYFVDMPTYPIDIYGTDLFVLGGALERPRVEFIDPDGNVTIAGIFSIYSRDHIKCTVPVLSVGNYTVRVVNATGPSNEVAFVMNDNLPSRPCELRVEVPNSYFVRLHWRDISSNETGFVVYTSIDGGAFDAGTQMAANVTTMDYPCSMGVHKYSFKIRAKNGHGLSDDTYVVKATVTSDSGSSPEFTNLNGYCEASVGDTLSFKVEAEDLDSTALTYAGPSGLFNSATQMFSWTPSSPTWSEGSDSSNLFTVSDGTHTSTKHVTMCALRVDKSILDDIDMTKYNCYAIYGNKVVLKNYYLYMYDLLTKEMKKIPGTARQYFGDIDGDRVLFSQIEGLVGIYVYTISKGTASKIAYGSFEHSLMALCEDNIVCATSKVYDTCDIKLINIPTGNQTTIAANCSGLVKVGMYDNKVVWLESDSMYIYDIATSQKTYLGESDYYEPFTMCEDKVGWLKDGMICIYEISTGNLRVVDGPPGESYIYHLVMSKDRIVYSTSCLKLWMYNINGNGHTKLLEEDWGEGYYYVHEDKILFQRTGGDNLQLVELMPPPRVDWYSTREWVPTRSLMTIKGFDFGRVPEDISVIFSNGTTVTDLVSLSPNEITFVVPDSAQSGQIKVQKRGIISYGWINGTVVPVYDLTVADGTGTGVYLNDSVAAITANAPPAGYTFDHWAGDTADVADVNSASTTVTMKANTFLTAVYSESGATPPVATLTSPVSGSTQSTKDISVQGTVSDLSITKVTLIGRQYVNGGFNNTYFWWDYPVTNGAFSMNIPNFLKDGLNRVEVSVSNTAGSGWTAAEVTYATGVTPPVVTLTSPVSGTTQSTKAIVVQGTVSDVSINKVTLIGRQYVNGGFNNTYFWWDYPVTNGTFSMNIPNFLKDGLNRVEVSVSNTAGSGWTAAEVTYATGVTPPVVTLTSPVSGSTQSTKDISVQGTVSDLSITKVTLIGRQYVNGGFNNTYFWWDYPVTNGTFSMNIPNFLKDGLNRVEVSVSNGAGSGWAGAEVTYQ